MMTLTRFVHFEPGHDCKRFRCRWNKADCKPGSGGFHGIHGLQIRFLVRGPKGAVQFVLHTGWLPEPKSWHGNSIAMPFDLGYHALEPQYEGQTPQKDSCKFLDGATCYYDGSSLNADEPFRILCNEGDEALWTYLEQYYRATFEAEEQPQGTPYPFPRRLRAAIAVAKESLKGGGA